MVYESDFYTTRRPYSHSRPTVTSYSVTNPRLTPAIGKAQTYHPSIPFIAHKKLTTVTTPVPHNSVRKTVISNTLDRIHHKPRSHQSYDPMEDFLNERSVTSFEDVTRSIRANTAALLKKVHTPIPRSVKPLSVSNLYNHTEIPIADRISSDEYIWHLLRPLPGKPSNGIDVGYYPESSTKIPLGKTHLACVSYAGGHPIAKRRQLVAGPGDDYRNVRNDVELLSHYTRMRQAANQPHENGIVSNDASNSGASRFKHYAPTTPHTTEKVTTNGPLSASLNEDDKENVVSNAQKPLKKKPSRDISVDEDQKQRDQEKALKEKQAEEERERERLLEQERKAEEERLEQERIAEQERKAEQERLEEEERKAEEERLEQERKAEEERLEQERLAEEERLAKEEEEKQRLLEEKLVEEYHREQERIAEEQRQRELEYAEEQQKLAQQKLAEEQKLLHEKLLEVKQQQEAEEENVEKDEEEEEEADDKSEPVQIEEVTDENDTEYVKCNNIPKDTDETEKKNESAEESEEASDEEPAIAENVQQNGSIEADQVVVIKKTIRSTFEYEEQYGTKSFDKNDDEKSENTDANSDISEAEEEPNNSTVPDADSKDQNEAKENKEEEETEEESEEDEEEEEEE
ncbi:golgin subfamily A member 6-like protein 6 isoform X2 [Planococcus citri]|uniref:golgin subfamily A member 6-like protein 6 isoform X2 n=1 Tax=Planococcus citri TaxID=170843 RepID=UPI0031F807E4